MELAKHYKEHEALGFPTTSAATASIPQVDTDPSSPAAEDAWVLKGTTGTGGGKLMAFLGLGFPYTVAGTLANTYKFSYRTNEGTTVRVSLT